MRDVEDAVVDVVVIGGDVASGPMPSETLALLESLGERVRFIRGNADRVLDFAGYGSAGEDEVWVRSRRWSAQRLGEERLRFLAGLPLDVVLDVEGVGNVRFCHGAPGSDEEAITRVTPEGRLRKLLAGIEERVVVCGHTHIQFDRAVAGVRIVNAGSVGAPYEARPGAYWLLAGPDLSHRCSAYDVHDAVRRIRATGYPNAEKFAQELVIDDASRPERMSALIEWGEE